MEGLAGWVVHEGRGQDALGTRGRDARDTFLVNLASDGGCMKRHLDFKSKIQDFRFRIV